MLFIVLQAGIFITFLSSIALIHLIYFKVTFRHDTRLKISNLAQRWYTLEHHLQMFQLVQASLPKERESNRPLMTLQMTQFDFGLGSLPLAVPSSDIYYRAADAIEDFSISSNHDVTLAGRKNFPYVLARDLHISHSQSIQAKFLVARDNLLLHSEDLAIDALLSGGDLEVHCANLRTTRIVGRSLGINAKHTPSLGRQAFALRDNSNVAQSTQFLSTNTIWPGGTEIKEHVVCAKDLTIKEASIFCGTVKIYGDLRLMAPTIFLGEVIVNGSIFAATDVAFMSNVVVKQRLSCDGDLVAGQPIQRPVSLVAGGLKLTNSVVGNGLISSSRHRGIQYAI